MRNKKAKLSAILFLGLVVTGLQAQTLYVKEKVGIQTSLELTNICKLSFAEDNMTVYKTDGNTLYYAVSDLRYLSFDDFITRISKQNVEENSIVSLFPNPTTEQFQLNFESAKAVKVLIGIIDIQGRLIQQDAIDSQCGTNLSIISVSGLPNGLYICLIQSGNRTEAIKFLKK